MEEPVQGRQLRLAVDLETQKVGQRALSAFAPTGKGGFVAMDVNDGEVLALGSVPSFDPNQFARIIEPKAYKQLTSDENGSPLTNRATSGLYPTGSTFKLITATAALESDLIEPSETIFDPGKIEIGEQVFTNAGSRAERVRRPAPGAPGLERRLLLHARCTDERCDRGQRAAAVVRAAWGRPPHGDRPGRRRAGWIGSVP